MVEKISTWMKQFNPEHVFLWIQVSAIHPANRRFQKRFEILLEVMFSIKDSEFEYNHLSRKEYEIFLTTFDLQSKVIFSQLEDWQPFEQSKLIPYFYNQKKYYFFYGDLERPYELLNRLGTLINLAHKELLAKISQVEFLFIKSLEFQTRLLAKLKSEPVWVETQPNMHVPSQAFFDSFSREFCLDSLEAVPESIILDQGTCKQAGRLEPVTSILEHWVYARFTSGNSFYLLPQIHCQALYNLFNDLIIRSDELGEIEQFLFEEAMDYIRFRTTAVCSLNKSLRGILGQGEKKLLTNQNDSSYLLDENKVLIVKVVPPKFKEDISQEIIEAIQQFNEFQERRNRGEVRGIIAQDYEVLAVSPNRLEFYCVVVFRPTTYAFGYILPRDLPLNNIWILEVTDWEGLIEYSNSSKVLFDFFMKDTELQLNSHVISTNIMDRFAYYLSNKHVFLESGITPETIAFDPHYWHRFFHDKLYNKYKDDIHEILETKYPKSFSKIIRIKENVYEFWEPIWLNSGRIVKQGSDLIWLFYPSDLIECTHDEIKNCIHFLGPLYSDYLNRLFPQIVELLQEYNYFNNDDFTIQLLPSSLVLRHEDYALLRYHIQFLNDEEPIMIMTNINDDSLYSVILYDFDRLHNKFEAQDNTGERYCLYKLVYSFIYCFENDPELIRIKAQNFIKDNIPVQTKGYTVELHHIDNPNLKYYYPPQAITEADCSKVRKMIAERLFLMGVKPGEYTDVQAKKIINSLVIYLEQFLEEEVKNFNESVLYKTYEQCELVEGLRETTIILHGMNASKYTEYDVVEEHYDKASKISELATITKQLLVYVLKTKTNGNTIITTSQICHLMAIVDALNQMITISDYIHYHLLSYRLILTESYEISYKAETGVIDHQKYYWMDSQMHVETAKSIYEQRKSIQINEDVHKVLPEYKANFDLVFYNEYGFKFSNLINILYCLGTSSNNTDYRFLSVWTITEIIQEVREYVFDCPSEDEIKKILDFVSLSFASYSGDTVVHITKLLRRKERPSLCPIIKLNSSRFLFGNQMCLTAMRDWAVYIEEADFPFYLDEQNQINVFLKAYHRQQELELEDRTAEVARKIVGEHFVEARINNFTRLSSSFPKKPPCGEIDALVVHSDSKTVYVLDAKNIKKKLLPADIEREMRKFKDHEAMLLKKKAFVEENLTTTLRYFKIDNSSNWNVQAGFVVSKNYPSAHASKFIVDFIQIDYLSEYLTANIKKTP
jgi:hypothetical protein